MNHVSVRRWFVAGSILLVFHVGTPASAQVPDETVIIEEAFGDCAKGLTLKILRGSNESDQNRRSIEVSKETLSSNCEALLRDASLNIEEATKQLHVIAKSYYAAYRKSDNGAYQKLWARPEKAPRLRPPEDCGGAEFGTINKEFRSWLSLLQDGANRALAMPSPDEHGVPTAIVLDSVVHAVTAKTRWDGSTLKAIDAPLPAAKVQFEQPVSCGRSRWAVTTWEWLLERDERTLQYLIISQASIHQTRRK